MCITEDWATKPAFLDDVTHILAVRSGHDNAKAADVLSLPRDALKTLTMGTIIVLCGQTQSSDRIKSLIDGLHLPSEQVVECDISGHVDNDRQEEVLATVEKFVDEHRHSAEVTEQREEFIAAIDFRREARDVLGNKAVQSAVVRIADLAKIILPNLQISFM